MRKLKSHDYEIDVLNKETTGYTHVMYSDKKEHLYIMMNCLLPVLRYNRFSLFTIGCVLTCLRKHFQQVSSTLKYSVWVLDVYSVLVH